MLQINIQRENEMNKGGEGRGRPSLEFRGVAEMAKQQWRSKSFCNHIDPDKEEQLKRVKIGTRCYLQFRYFQEIDARN